ncbi:hypothetical protein D8I24_7895 [Cupriavidus necator H850]|nr:hypothetical protein D8I24_7895 [Cupriavidus necator H850]
MSRLLQWQLPRYYGHPVGHVGWRVFGQSCRCAGSVRFAERGTAADPLPSLTPAETGRSRRCDFKYFLQHQHWT